MAIKRLPRPRDPIALAKLIGDIATGQVVDAVEDGKDQAAVESRARGRVSGGAARASRSVQGGKVGYRKKGRSGQVEH